ncbi:ComF family protein [Pseudorhizobium endolithicum]|uniref:ComF family protein n=1 Tax=Pseudorhizobium endolithicum TaxID=1191678 RepID=A0ABM8PK88_9HYPH|nr:ComF family protein [Pseudorhizobium endolithicum]CAD7034534.1 ComF family protein [Pseudorhizobium endolithicum]
MAADPPLIRTLLTTRPYDWLQRLGDLVYPATCPGCGILTGGHSGFCPNCWTEIRFIERPYCEVLGIPFSYDPGEGMVCADAIADPPVFDRLRSVAIHEGPVRHLVHGLKYRDRTDRSAMMAHWMLRASHGFVAGCDAVVPVPLHRWRFASRRFNQSAELARHLARLSDRPFLPSTLVRVKNTSRQVGLTARGRVENVRAAFKVVPGRETDVAGRHILLVDDVFTTGATVSSATRALKKAGASEVTVLTFAMAISGPI